MRVRSAALPCLVLLLASCAAVLGLPDPILDDTIPISSSSSGSSGGDAAPADGAPLDDAAGDAPSDAPTDAPAFCTKRTPWTVSLMADPTDSGTSFLAPSLTDDEQTVYLEIAPLLNENQASLFFLARGPGGGWDGGGGLVSGASNFPAKASPCIALDGGTLFFSAGPVAPHN